MTDDEEPIRILVRPESDAELGGLPSRMGAEIMKPSDNEDIVVVAIRWNGGELMMDDNITDHCQICGHGIQLRPYMPKINPLICVNCFMEEMANGDDGLDDRIKAKIKDNKH